MPVTPTPRKRRTRKAKVTTTAPKSVNKVTPKEATKVTEITDSIEIELPEGTNLTKRPMNVEAVKVDVQRRKLTELSGLELVILPLVYLEGFVKFILQETAV